MKNIKSFFDFLYTDYSGESKLVVFNEKTAESVFLNINDNNSYRKIVELIEEGKINKHDLFFNLSLQDEFESKKKRVIDNKNKINSKFIIECLKIYDYNTYRKYIEMITKETIIMNDDELNDEEKEEKVEIMKSSYDLDEILNNYIDWELFNNDFEKRKKLDKYITDYTKYTRGSVNTVTHNFGMWLDVDIAIEGHHKSDKNMFTTHSQAKEFLLSLDIKPNVLVNSGGGYHAYYVFDKVVKLKNIDIKIEHNQLVKKFEVYVKQEAEKQNFHGSIDPVNDLARMLRLPFSNNNKNMNNIKEVTIDYFNEKKNIKKEIKEFLSHIVVENNTTKEKSRNNKFDKDFYNFNIKIKMLDGSVVNTMDKKLSPRLSENLYNNCSFVKTVLDNPVESNYKERLHLIQLLLHTEDYDEYFDMLYEGQPLDKQDRITTTIDEMEKRLYPPPTCETIRTNCNFDCSNCSFSKEIHSPISLARKKI